VDFPAVAIKTIERLANRHEHECCHCLSIMPLSRIANESQFVAADVVGNLAGGMTFDEIQREYDLSADDIRAALKFVSELAEQESCHPLPLRELECVFSLTQTCPDLLSNS
jgi:hypothetical protein